MNVIFRLPPMQRRGSTETELEELKRYIFQLVQEMNAVMALIDDEGSSAKTQTQAVGQEQIIRRAQGQLAKSFLPRGTFDGYFRAGLLDEDSSGQHYGVEIGERKRDGSFERSVRFEAGTVTIGDVRITQKNGHLMLE